MDLTTWMLLLAIGLIAGLASGFVGIGGGMIIVPALVFVKQIKIKGLIY